MKAEARELEDASTKAEKVALKLARSSSLLVAKGRGGSTKTSESSLDGTGSEMMSGSLPRREIHMHGASTVNVSGEIIGHLMSTNEVATEEVIKEITAEMFKTDIFDAPLLLEELQLNLGFLRTTTEPNLRLWLHVFEGKWTSHRSKRVEESIDRRKLHNDKRRQAQENSEAGNVAVRLKEDDYVSDDEDEEDDDYEGENTRDDDAQRGPVVLMADVECQAALTVCDSLANLDARLPRTEETANGASAEAAVTDDEKAKRNEERWVRICAAAIHQADVSAAKLPAQSALQKLREQEAQATADTEELIARIAKIRVELEEARNEPGTGSAKPTDEMKAEREDLEVTRAAIKEAREEVEQLKRKLAEQNPAAAAAAAAAVAIPVASTIGKAAGGGKPAGGGKEVFSEKETKQFKDGIKEDTPDFKVPTKGADGGVSCCVTR